VALVKYLIGALAIQCREDKPGDKRGPKRDTGGYQALLVLDLEAIAETVPTLGRGGLWGRATAVGSIRIDFLAICTKSSMSGHESRVRLCFPLRQTDLREGP
jgi:hypothetical protein